MNTAGGETPESDPVPGYDSAATGEDQQPPEELLNRPTFRIRTRLTVALLVVFALCAVITGWIIYTLTQLEARIHFLEVADSYMAEVQQARRFEKNFLLYGTNLDDALEHMRSARALLDQNRPTLSTVFGEENLDALATHVTEYSRNLQQLGEPDTEVRRTDSEAALRVHGAGMISSAIELSSRERAAVERSFGTMRGMAFAFLGVLLAVILFIAAFLARHFLGTLRRFEEYAARIGEGDFSPIKPVRKYRDEFSLLAAAFNRMTRELDRRHRILVESHKLRAIGTLVAGVAHELNNPLNNIMLTASLLLEDLREVDPEAAEEMVTDIVDETERSQRIVRGLLDFARESEVSVEPLHISEIVDNAARLIGNQVKMAKVKLQVEAEDGLPPIHGDARMLCQVFVNLMLNAVDALSAGGRIHVRVGRATDSGFVAVEISDDGPGIPEHVLPRVFEPFFTTKTKGKGTGLGLSVSRGIIQKLGGFIRAESPPDHGAIFTVLLPTTEIPFTSGAPEPGGEARSPDAPPPRSPA